MDANCRHLRRRQGPRLRTWESSTTRPRCRPPSRSSSRRGCRAGRGPRDGRSPARSGSTASTTPPARWASRRSSGAPTTAPCSRRRSPTGRLLSTARRRTSSAPPTTRCSASAGCTTGVATRCGPPRWSMRSRQAADRRRCSSSRTAGASTYLPGSRSAAAAATTPLLRSPASTGWSDEGAVTVVTAGDGRDRRRPSRRCAGGQRPTPQRDRRRQRRGDRAGRAAQFLRIVLPRQRPGSAPVTRPRRPRLGRDVLLLGVDERRPRRAGRREQHRAPEERHVVAVDERDGPTCWPASGGSVRLSVR